MRGLWVLLLFAPFSISAAFAHSASDAYISLKVDTRKAQSQGAGLIMHGQWDIALRDLDFVLHLDADGDGHLTWAEVRRSEDAITRYAYSRLQVTAGGNQCAVLPLRLSIDGHADGAYAALFFDVRCAAATQKIALDYNLFFGLDPTHRGILVLQNQGGTATAVLSPQNPRIEWPL
jgi:hypothetical protein